MEASPVVRDQSADGIGWSSDESIGASSASLARGIADALVPGWALPVGVATIALLVLQGVNHSFMRDSVPLTLATTCSLVVLFGTLYVAIVHADQRTAPVRMRLVTTAIVAGLAVNTVVQIWLLVPHLSERNRYAVDAGAATDCATQLFMHGHDPYTNVHMLTCLNSHGLAFNQTTPIRAGAFWSLSTYPSGGGAHGGLGSKQFDNLMWSRYWKDLSQEKHNSSYVSSEFETRFNYPGGAILIGVVAWALGVRDLVGLFLGAVFVASYLIYRGADRRIQLVTMLLLLGDAPLLLDSAVGATDVLYAMILVVYWQLRGRPLAAGLMLGLAIATRQQAWFFAPFLLYLGWRTGGWRDLWLRLLPAVVVFFLCNLPFILLNPGDWVSGILGPMRDPLFAEGVGIVAIPIALLKQQIGPPLLYVAIELVAYCLAFRLFTRRCLSAPGLAMLLPLVCLAFAWRSLHTYFLILPLLATAVLASADGEHVVRPNAARRFRWGWKSLVSASTR